MICSMIADSNVMKMASNSKLHIANHMIDAFGHVVQFADVKDDVVLKSGNVVQRFVEGGGGTLVLEGNLVTLYVALDNETYLRKR